MGKVSKGLIIKKELIAACLQHQEKLVNNAREAMLHAQESANEEPGSMGDKFESFREQCHLDRDMFAKQMQEAMSGYAILKQLQVEKAYEQVQPGCVVITDTQQLFIAVSIGAVKANGAQYFVISTQSPLYQAMSGKKKGEIFNFRDKSHVIKEIF